MTRCTTFQSHKKKPIKETVIQEEKSHEDLIHHDSRENTTTEIEMDTIEMTSNEENNIEHAETIPQRSSRRPHYSERYLEYRKTRAQQAISFGVPAQTQNAKTNQSQPSEPSTYMEATTGEAAEHWIPAIFDEYESLMQNKTWNHQEERPLKGNGFLNSNPDTIK